MTASSRMPSWASLESSRPGRAPGLKDEVGIQGPHDARRIAVLDRRGELVSVRGEPVEGLDVAVVGAELGALQGTVKP